MNRVFWRYDLSVWQPAEVLFWVDAVNAYVKFDTGYVCVAPVQP